MLVQSPSTFICLKSNRIGNKTVDVCHMTYRCRDHRHLLGCWFTIMLSVVVTGLLQGH